jgi:hypothetical protein
MVQRASLEATNRFDSSPVTPVTLSWPRLSIAAPNCHGPVRSAACRLAASLSLPHRYRYGPRIIQWHFLPTWSLSYWRTSILRFSTAFHPIAVLVVAARRFAWSGTSSAPRHVMIWSVRKSALTGPSSGFLSIRDSVTGRGVPETTVLIRTGRPGDGVAAEEGGRKRRGGCSCMQRRGWWWHSAKPRDIV